jgi:DNA-binding MarR family transcriptional regulator
MLEPIEGTRDFVLANFVPFRLNRLADAVSLKLSEIYRDRFGLEVPEWRVLVTVGERKECTAQQIAQSTRMHKTRVSRAVRSLEERQLLARSASGIDGREIPLCLSAAGRRLHASLVPLALEREREILSCLSSSQCRTWLNGLSALEESLGLIGDE